MHAQRVVQGMKEHRGTKLRKKKKQKTHSRQMHCCSYSVFCCFGWKLLSAVVSTACIHALPYAACTHAYTRTNERPSPFFFFSFLPFINYVLCTSVVLLYSVHCSAVEVIIEKGTKFFGRRVETAPKLEADVCTGIKKINSLWTNQRNFILSLRCYIISVIQQN